MAPKYKSISSSSVQLKKQKVVPTLERKLTDVFTRKQYAVFTNAVFTKTIREEFSRVIITICDLLYVPQVFRT